MDLTENTATSYLEIKLLLVLYTFLERRVVACWPDCFYDFFFSYLVGIWFQKLMGHARLLCGVLPIFIKKDVFVFKFMCA